MILTFPLFLLICLLSSTEAGTKKVYYDSDRIYIQPAKHRHQVKPEMKDELLRYLLNAIMSTYPCPRPYFVPTSQLEKLFFTPLLTKVDKKMMKKLSGRRSLVDTPLENLTVVNNETDVKGPELEEARKAILKKKKHKKKTKSKTKKDKKAGNQTQPAITENPELLANDSFWDSDEDDKDDYDTVNKQHNYNLNVLARRNLEKNKSVL